jgi:hypothetical protein
VHVKLTMHVIVKYLSNLDTNLFWGKEVLRHLVADRSTKPSKQYNENIL